MSPPLPLTVAVF